LLKDHGDESDAPAKMSKMSKLCSAIVDSDDDGADFSIPLNRTTIEA
jgi:hypothetical protein